jgi:flagellar protein FlaG
MEVNDIKPIDAMSNYPYSNNSVDAKTEKDNEITTEGNNMHSKDGTAEKKDIKPEEIKNINSMLNKFMENINADIKFVFHEGTKRLIVQVVDTKENKVLKEFPPHELLDTMARIREYVGVLLDERA